MKTPVSIWILVARTDIPYMLQTIPHQIRACNYPFVERVLAVDTAPLTGDKCYRYDTGSQEDLETACQTLIDRGVADRVVKIDYHPDLIKLIKQIYTKYFGAEQALQMLDHTHNTLDKGGFYAHNFFSMGAYLVNRDRFAELAPIPLMWKHPPLKSRYLVPLLQPLFAKLERRLTGQKGSINGAIASFEPMTSRKLEMTKYVD